MIACEPHVAGRKRRAPVFLDIPATVRELDELVFNDERAGEAVAERHDAVKALHDRQVAVPAHDSRAPQRHRIRVDRRRVRKGSADHREVEHDAALIEAVAADRDRHARLISLKLVRREPKIPGSPAHAIKHLDEGFVDGTIGAAAAENARNQRPALGEIGGDELDVPALEEPALAATAVIALRMTYPTEILHRRPYAPTVRAIAAPGVGVSSRGLI